MPNGTLPLLIALILLVILSGFFSATETAYSCSNLIRLRALYNNGNKRYGKVLDLAENKYDKLITTILICNNIVNLSAATISTIFFAKIITSGVDSSVISTIVITVAVLIFGEITPKFIAKSAPEKTAALFYPVVMFFFYVCYPFNLLFTGWKWLLGKIFRIKPNDVITEDEIMTIVSEAEEDGTLKKEETKLIRSVIEFDDVEVGDILVPRVNICAISQNSSMDDIKRLFLKEGFSRIPVYSDSIDTIIGVVHEKDFFSAYLNGCKDIKNIIQTVPFTTEHVKISNLLKKLQKKRTHLAVVLDEYGGTLGIVTLEDILEELVGEIYDEHDEKIEYFKRVNKNFFIVKGNMPLADLFNLLKLDNADDFESDTTSGWIIEQLGEIPLAGRKFDYQNVGFEISKSTVKRVLEVKVTVKNIND